MTGAAHATLVVRAAPLATRLVLDPPLLDVVRGADGRWRRALDLLVHEEQDVLVVEEGVRRVGVELLVDGRVLLLARGLRAIGTVATGNECRVDDRVAVTDVVELTLALLARVPDRIRVLVQTEGPSDDEALVVGARVGAIEEDVEGFEHRLDLHADGLVLLHRDLKDRLARGVAG